MRIKRVSPRGLTFYITTICDEKDKAMVALSETEKELEFNASLDRISAGWYDWQVKGRKVQEAFPFLSDDEREFLMTGLTPEEWDRMVPSADD